MKSDNLSALTEVAGHAALMNGDEFGAPESGSERPPSGMNLDDILFILFRHKWKISFFAIVGIAAAAAVLFLYPSVYESRAKLLVRYVVERSAVDSIDSSVKTLGSQGETLINSEVEILSSLDLATKVAEKIGIERVLGRSGEDATLVKAARTIVGGLTVTALKGSNILIVTYKNRDPVVAEDVLQELIKQYFDKHLEIHRSVGAFEFVTKQTEQLRTQLDQTEEELKQLKAKLGITSLAESTTAVATELTKAQEELDSADAEFASQQARMKEIEKSLTGAETKPSHNAPAQASGEVVRQYQSLVAREAQLRQMETDLLSRYTPQNRIVKVKQAQIGDLVNQRRELEKKNPGLLATVSNAASPDGSRVDIVSERARLAEIESKRGTAKSRLNGLQQQANQLSEYGPRIAQLERTKEVLETNYKYYGASLEKARIDENLDPTRMPNISIVQTASTAIPATEGAGKIAAGLAGGGLALGIGLALLIELVLDRTVKRSLELERRLRIPLMLSIPNFSGSSQTRLRLRETNGDGTTVLSEDGLPDQMSESGQFLRPFCEAIRDRLALYFELNRMATRPKLVAVTGLSKNAGASTLAAGLAAAISETGDGKVLLVDQPFAPKRFYNMLEQFKESDLEYIIFDMPALTEASNTLSMAGFMDKVLLVVEAEKSNRDAVKRAYGKLAARAKVSVVFNKSRSYGPNWLQEEG